MRTTPTNKICVYEVIKSRLNCKECLLPASSECFAFQFGVYRTKVVPVLYGCETWSATREHKAVGAREYGAEEDFEAKVGRNTALPDLRNTRVT